MRIRSTFLLVSLALLGCESLEERRDKLSSSWPAERIDAVQAIEEILAEEEVAAREEGRPPSPEALARLAELARLAQRDGGDPDPQARAACLAVLGRSPFWQEPGVFREALKDPSERCVYEALHALRLRKDRETIPAATRLLAESREIVIRLEAVALIRELGAKEAIPALIGVVTNLLERNDLAVAAWLALRELTGQEFSSENFLAWDKWYKATYGAEKVPQERPSAVGSTPAEAKGAGGELPPEKR